MIRTILLSFLSFTAIGQLKPDEIVKVSTPAAVTQPGKSSTFRILVDVKNGYHIQAHDVKDEYIVPTTLQIEAGKDFMISPAIFPSTKKFKLEGTDNYLDVYDGRFEISVPFLTKDKISKDLYELSGTIKYQACDSVRCRFPKSIQFSIRVDVK